MKVIKKIFVIAVIIACVIYLEIMIELYLPFLLIGFFGKDDYSMTLRGIETVIIPIAIFAVKAVWKRLRE